MTMHPKTHISIIKIRVQKKEGKKIKEKHHKNTEESSIIYGNR